MLPGYRLRLLIGIFHVYDEYVKFYLQIKKINNKTKQSETLKDGRPDNRKADTMKEDETISVGLKNHYFRNSQAYGKFTESERSIFCSRKYYSLFRIEDLFKSKNNSESIC